MSMDQVLSPFASSSATETTQQPSVPPKFDPGFRVSRRDILVLVTAIGGAAALASVHAVFAAALLFVVGQFFLFCNVFRIRRSLELAWTAIFCLFAVLSERVGRPTWTETFLICQAMALLLIALEMQHPMYHGIGWRTLNPDLIVRWVQRHDGLTPPDR
jgi:hypothetical protein